MAKEVLLPLSPQNIFRKKPSFQQTEGGLCVDWGLLFQDQIQSRALAGAKFKIRCHKAYRGTGRMSWGFLVHWNSRTTSRKVKKIMSPKSSA